MTKGHRAIDEKSAFIMSNMMKGVVERGTGWRVRALNRPVAGKTGTSNDQMDAWFIGFTPEWACGVWTGFDVKRTIGKDETGGKAAAPMFVDFMGKFLEYRKEQEQGSITEDARKQAEELGIPFEEPEELPPSDFRVPEGVDPIWVNKFTGRPSSSEDPEAILDFFVRGSEPGVREVQQEMNSYLEGADF
jgi:penicillin-binding protein 1A